MHTPLSERFNFADRSEQTNSLGLCVFTVLQLRDCESSLEFLEGQRRLYPSPDNVPYQLVLDIGAYRKRRVHARQSLGGRGFTREQMQELLRVPFEGLAVAVEGLLQN